MWQSNCDEAPRSASCRSAGIRNDARMNAIPAEAQESLPIKALALAVVIGLLGASLATFFMWLIEEGQVLFFTDLPQAFGWDAAPAWWITGGLLLSALLIIAAQRLPGHTGEGPLTGFHFNDPVRTVPSVLLAAVATLIFGASLGPEGPLIVVGSTAAALLMRKAQPNVLSMAMFLGGIAAIGTIFGNPFVTAFMILEFAAMGMAPKVILLPAFVALGAGYITQIGWGAWAGIGTHGLSVPGLPDYPSIQPGDLAAGLVLAIVVSIATSMAREIGERASLLGQRRPAATIILAAMITSAIAVSAFTWFDIEYDQILFSGQTGMASLITETSLTTLLVIIICKLVVYGVALGSGFRGGPIFPATFIGVACGGLAALLLTGLSISAMAAVGIAAAATVMTRLPFTSALLAMLLVGVAGAAIAPFAIIGAVSGFVVRSAVDRLKSRRSSTSTSSVDQAMS